MPEQDFLSAFFDERKGKIVCIADDASLVRTLRYSIVSYSKDPDGLIYNFESVGAAALGLEEINKHSKSLVILIDRKIAGEKTTDMVLRISRLYPAACLIVAGSNITKELAAYYYEIGVSNVVSKPVSADEILKKLLICLRSSKERLLTTHVRELIAETRSKEALEVLDEYLGSFPESGLAYCLMGDVLFTDGEMKKALEAYELAAQMNVQFTEPLKRLAAIYKHIDDMKALELLKRVEGVSPFNPDRKLEMAEIHLRNGQVEQAEAFFEKGFRQASQEFHLLLGDYAERIMNLASEKMPALAEKFLKRVIETKTDFTMLDIHMFNRLGMMHRNKGEWKKAIAVYQKALGIAPDDPALHYNMALAYHDGGEILDVQRCLRNALELDSDFYMTNEGVAYNIGSIYLVHGDKAAAEPFFKRVLEINPENDRAKEKLRQCVAGTA